MKIKARKFQYDIILKSAIAGHVFPYIKDDYGEENMCCLSPYHGRSFIIKQNIDKRWVVSKGNGLSYSNKTFIHTKEFGIDTWGLLLKKDAVRDFKLGQEIEQLGIKTNQMEYVIEIKAPIQLYNGIKINPILLQYTVECPYRLCDIPFTPKNVIEEETKKWREQNKNKHETLHEIAAERLINTLKILHDNNILHNAIHTHNYTLALELLDFELASSVQHPYDKDDEQRHVKDLFPREIMQTYEIINYLAWVFNERINYKKIDNLFKDYGFNLSCFEANNKIAY